MNWHTGESQIVSRTMTAQMPLETPTNLWWDGFFAASEGQQIEDMPTPHHESGWWNAVAFGDCDHEPVVIMGGVDVAGEWGELVEAREDERFWREGC